MEQINTKLWSSLDLKTYLNLDFTQDSGYKLVIDITKEFYEQLLHELRSGYTDPELFVGRVIVEALREEEGKKFIDCTSKDIERLQ